MIQQCMFNGCDYCLHHCLLTRLIKQAVDDGQMTPSGQYWKNKDSVRRQDDQNETRLAVCCYNDIVYKEWRKKTATLRISEQWLI